MNRTLLKWLLAISLSLNLGIVTAVIVERISFAKDARRVPAESTNLPDYLQLTAGQRRQWDEIEQSFLKDIATNWSAIRKHRELLVREVFSPAPDRAAIDAAQNRIAALQEVQQRRVIEQLLAERAVLNDAQRAQLMALLLSRYEQESTEEERLHRR